MPCSPHPASSSTRGDATTLAPQPARALVQLAVLIRERVAGVANAVGVGTVVVGAAAPFAPTAYARARLLRQLHASGLLSASELRRAEQLPETTAEGRRAG